MTVKDSNVALDQQISDLGLAPDLVEALRGAVRARDVETDREASYISVRPAGRHIAAYFNKRHVDIAVDPQASGPLSAQHHGTSVLAKTTATHYLRVPEGCLSEVAVVELVTAALDWRERGHQCSGNWAAGESADLAGETCQTCFLEIARNGTCGCD